MRNAVLAAACLFLAASCATLSKDDGFLVKNVDDVNKAISLTNQGVAAYTEYLVKDADYGRASEVREFFAVALRFDPDNTRAKQYLAKVDDFKSSLVRDKLKAADKLLAKPKRKPEEDYALITALQIAAAVDPANERAAKLLKDNAAAQASLTDSYLKQSKDAQAKAAAAKDGDSKQSLDLQAYDAAAKAAALSPGSADAAKQKAALAAELGKAFDARKASFSKLMGQGKFEASKGEIAGMSAIDAKLGKARAPEVAGATYALYYAWAKYLFGKGSLQDADDRLDLALAAKRTDEAVSLRKRIEAQAATVNQDAAFDAALPEIDKLIAKADYLAANKRIASASRLTKDAARLSQLDARRSKIADALGGLYDKGVAAYRAEDFKGAIDLLQVVVGIDAGYEQAADYLGKAQEKQKLLDQYSD